MSWDQSTERGPLAPAGDEKFDFRAKTAGRWAGSCPHPPSTNPVHISTHPPHPRWASRLMRLVSNRLTSRRIRRSREPLTLKMRGNGWSEKTIDQRKLLWLTQNPNHNRVPNRSQNFRANNPSDVLTQSICVLHRNAFSLTGLEKEVELMNWGWDKRKIYRIPMCTYTTST